jgi:tetratricopeptide (TPR) repeat protein
MSVRDALRGGIVASMAILAVGCGSSVPKQAATATPAVVEPEPEAAAAPTAESRRGNRREERRPLAEDPAATALEPVPEAAQQAYGRAIAALHAQDWLQAELELEQLAHDYPGFPGPLVNLAIVYQRDGRRDDARAALGRALEIAPGNAAANNQLETDPSYGLAHYNLAVLLDVYLRRGAEAIAHYEAYQTSLSEPNKTVAGWLIDLRRRFGNAASASQVAKEDGA